MKLYCVTFEKDQNYKVIRDIVKKADPNAVIALNESTGKKVYELQSEVAANTLVSELGGKLTVVKYDIKDVYK